MTKEEIFEIFDRYDAYETLNTGETVQIIHWHDLKHIAEEIIKNCSIPDVSARLYSLELHETLYAHMQWGLRTDITRVPGGWIYQPICRHHNGKDEYYAPCFVPFNNEFQNVR